MKLDDDVFVNMRPLATHLFELFGQSQLNSNFIYCHTINMATPQRKSHGNKWFVSFDSYPFQYYPRYCEGFAYVSKNFDLLRGLSSLIL